MQLHPYFAATLLLYSSTNVLAASTRTGETEKGVTEYYTAYLNISYFDKSRGVFHTERTETARYSTNKPTDFYGVVVPLISNFTVISKDNESLPDIHFGITGKTYKQV